MTTHPSTQTQTAEPMKTRSGDSRLLFAANHDMRHENTATIASVSDQDFWVTRTYGAFHIPARPKNEPYGFVVVTPRAADIIQDLEDHGIVVCEAARPSPEEIAAAIERRDAWYKQLVADADEMWARGHSYREISDMHRRAAKSLGLEREWAYVPQRSVDCPACGEKVRADVAMCKHCGATLDAERAAKYFPNGPRQKFAPGNNISSKPNLS